MTTETVPIVRTPVFDETQPLITPLHLLDLDHLRRAFSALLDEAARALHLGGLDLDDAILDRQIKLRWTVGADRMQHWLTSVPLSDATRLTKLILSTIADECGACPEPSDVELAAVRVVAVAERFS